MQIGFVNLKVCLCLKLVVCKKINKKVRPCVLDRFAPNNIVNEICKLSKLIYYKIVIKNKLCKSLNIICVRIE